MNQLILIENNGQELSHTNFWDHQMAARGFLFLSWNAGSARLLVPDNQKLMIDEIRSAKYAIISVGRLNGKSGPVALEILFEDNSDSPFSVQINYEQCDRILPKSAHRSEFLMSIWTRDGEALQMPGKYRVVDKLPYLKEWKV